MRRKQASLVPTGEVVGELDGPVTARNYCTMAHQIGHLLKARDAEPELGFMARMMVLCSMPRSNPGNRKEYKRQNGPFTLYMNATAGNKLPTATCPAYSCLGCAAKRYGREAANWSWDHRCPSSCESWGSTAAAEKKHTRLRNQMDRLFNASVSLGL